MLDHDAPNNQLILHSDHDLLAQEQYRTYYLRNPLRFVVLPFQWYHFIKHLTLMLQTTMRGQSNQAFDQFEAAAADRDLLLEELYR